MVRRYADRPLPDGLVDELAAAALRAPSAGFTQAVSLLICESETDRESFWSAAAPEGAGRWLEGMRTAPALLQVWTSEQAYLDRYAEPDKGWTDRDPGRWSAPYWWVDAGMASMLTLLTAVDSGLGANFFGIPTDRIPAVRAAFRHTRRAAQRGRDQRRLPRSSRPAQRLLPASPTQGGSAADSPWSLELIWVESR